eukprot:scaffold4360_cov199-Amphora_coffeaeformis.AAC.3
MAFSWRNGLRSFRRLWKMILCWETKFTNDAGNGVGQGAELAADEFEVIDCYKESDEELAELPPVDDKNYPQENAAYLHSKKQFYYFRNGKGPFGSLQRCRKTSANGSQNRFLQYDFCLWGFCYVERDGWNGNEDMNVKDEMVGTNICAFGVGGLSFAAENVAAFSSQVQFLDPCLYVIKVASGGKSLLCLYKLIKLTSVNSSTAQTLDGLSRLGVGDMIDFDLLDQKGAGPLMRLQRKQIFFVQQQQLLQRGPCFWHESDHARPSTL